MNPDEPLKPKTKKIGVTEPDWSKINEEASEILEGNDTISTIDDHLPPTEGSADPTISINGVPMYKASIMYKASTML